MNDSQDCICKTPDLGKFHSLKCPKNPSHELYVDLVRTNEAVDKQIKETIALAEKQGINVYKMQNMNGMFMLTPLLTARAQCLSGLALLHFKDE